MQPARPRHHVDRARPAPCHAAASAATVPRLGLVGRGMLLCAALALTMARVPVAAATRAALPAACQAEAARLCSTQDSFAARPDNQMLCLKAFRTDLNPACRRAIGPSLRQGDTPNPAAPGP